MLLRRSCTRTVIALAGCSLMLASAGLLAGDAEPTAAPGGNPHSAELPSFQPGLWEYRRTLQPSQSANPQASSIKKCANPDTEMREKKAALQKKGCQFEPVKRHDNRYTSSWTCTTPSGPVKFRAVLIVKDPMSYQELSEMLSGEHVIQQKIEANRIGECAPTAPGGLKTPNPKTQPHP